MRSLSASFPLRFRRGPLLAFGIFIFGLVIAYKLADYIVSDDLTSLAFAGMAVIGGVFVIAILNNWRNGLYFFFAWLLFEDFARKYLGNNMAIYFAKDFLVAVVYLSFFIAWRRKQLQSFRPPFLVPLMIMVWFGVLQVFNPESPSCIYGLLGMKLFFYYIPLMLVGYALMDSEEELRRFLTMNLILIVLITG